MSMIVVSKEAFFGTRQRFTWAGLVHKFDRGSKSNKVRVVVINTICNHTAKTCM